MEQSKPAQHTVIYEALKGIEEGAVGGTKVLLHGSEETSLSAQELLKEGFEDKKRAAGYKIGEIAHEAQAKQQEMKKHFNFYPDRDTLN